MRARVPSSLNRSASSELNRTAGRRNRCAIAAAEDVEVAVVESPASDLLEIQLYPCSRYCSFSCSSQSIPFCCKFYIEPNRPAVNETETVKNQSEKQSLDRQKKLLICSTLTLKLLLFFRADRSTSARRYSCMIQLVFSPLGALPE